MRKKAIYFVGIKGTGMSALAQCLSDIGYEVLGSDVDEDYKTSAGLEERNIKILPFQEHNIKKQYFYIIGNAFDDKHCEVKAIKKNKYPHLYYHEWIGRMKGFHIAISGTHGKTTTTALVTNLLGDLPCAYLIGDGSGGGRPDYQYFIYEACEYKNHFLSYYPDILVINNIELDHPDFFNSVEQVLNSFQKIASQAKCVYVNGDDHYAKLIKHENLIRFGRGETNDIILKVIKETENSFDVTINEVAYQIPFVGNHMLYNAMVAIAIATKLGIHKERIQELLNHTTLPKRRMEIKEIGDLVLVDDYAHHPTEIKSLYQALHQKYPNHTIHAIFQPHTYSRTLALKNEFIDALRLFDYTYIEKVFASAREKVEPSLQEKVDEIFQDFIPFTSDILKRIKQEKAVWVFLGAGIVNRYMKKLNL